VEVAIVLLVGAMISTGYWSAAGLVLAAMLFFVVRPVAVWLGVPASLPGRAPRRLLAWFGIRGIGSVYYAVYFAGFELRDAVATDVLSAAFTVIAASIVVHGISAAPLMELYRLSRGSSRSRAGSERAVSDKQ
jgi:NhaP-type Na+/H+ or K+/H+ antiporter